MRHLKCNFSEFTHTWACSRKFYLLGLKDYKDLINYQIGVNRIVFLFYARETLFVRKVHFSAFLYHFQPLKKGDLNGNSSQKHPNCTIQIRSKITKTVKFLRWIFYHKRLYLLLTKLLAHS